MSTHSAVRKLDVAVNLESLKKEAKSWLKSLRDDDAAALERLRRVIPTADNNVGLREIQRAIALEFGATGWTELKDLLAEQLMAKRTAAERADDFLRHALDRQEGVLSAQILRKHPEVTKFSIHTAAASGDVAEVQRRLKLDHTVGSSIGGSNNWQALQYLCYARIPLPQASEQTTDNSVVIASALLDTGGDPNATHKDDWDNPFTLITGVIGQGEQQDTQHPHAVELAQLLLDRGAEPYDTQSMYNTSLLDDDIFWLDLLYSRSEAKGEAGKWRTGRYGPLPENCMLDYLLGNAVSRNHLQRARWLLDRGARATAKHSYSKRTLHTEAVLHGFVDMAALLETLGAQPEKLEDRHAYQAACMRCDDAVARQLLTKQPHLLFDPTPMIMAADYDKADVASFLLELGMSPNVGNGSWTALHSAAYNGSLRVARMLVERGATVDVRETKYKSTPLGHAIYARKQAMIEFLSQISRDVFALVKTGNAQRLCEVLDADPSLVKSKLGNKSLLFYLSGPEEQAIEVAELLLARGADPTEKDADGMTPGEIAAKYGFDDLAEMLSEACSKRVART